MRVFISWSGDLSKNLGEAFRNWLPSVLQMVKPYFTPSDIEKGARWSSHIANELEQSSLGIFCLTRENLDSPWIMFEAGAVSKIVGNACVCPILFGIDDSDVTGPLSQFQLTKFTKTDIKRLIDTINNLCGEQKLLDNTRDSVFEMWWQKLEEEVTEIIDNYREDSTHEIRSDREVLEEVLSIARLLARDKKVQEEANRKSQFIEILADNIKHTNPSQFWEAYYNLPLNETVKRERLDQIKKHLEQYYKEYYRKKEDENKEGKEES